MAKNQRRQRGGELSIGRIPEGYRALFAEAERQGWRIEKRPGQHFALWPPDGSGTPVFASSSPSDGGRHSARKVLSDLRRRGFDPTKLL